MNDKQVIMDLLKAFRLLEEYGCLDNTSDLPKAVFETPVRNARKAVGLKVSDWYQYDK